MNLSPQQQAVLLLTAWFAKPSQTDPQPLSPKEWGKFARWLADNKLSPESLISGPDAERELRGWSDPRITTDRILRLLDRGGALGLALEKWERTGLWVMTRSDSDYPGRLKKLLKFDAPPVLFGCGNRRLLESNGIAVIGSREASEADLVFTKQLGQAIASQGYSVVSGGARGVDEAAMLGALDMEGTVIGILADSLTRAATSAKYRAGLKAGNLVLLSPYHPDARFEVGKAMGRNKYIYCLSEAAIVIASASGKGGTWSGAVENLKNAWVPLWVNRTREQGLGNAALVDQGGAWLPSGAPNIELVKLIFDEPAANAVADSACPTIAPDENDRSEQADLLELSHYELFLVQVREATSASPLTVEELESHTGLIKGQLQAWLKQGVMDGKIEKLNRPVRYQWKLEQQLDLV